MTIEIDGIDLSLSLGKLGLKSSRWNFSYNCLALVHESGATLAPDLGVPVSKMEESIDNQASLLTAQNPEGWGTLPSVSGR